MNGILVNALIVIYSFPVKELLALFLLEYPGKDYYINRMDQQGIINVDITTIEIAQPIFREKSMYDIFVKTHFAGAHHLRDYPGDCEKPHGHNWKVKVTVRATELDELGMGIDFTVLKKHVKEVIDTIDHCDLNEHEAFKVLNPSSEHIAQYLFNNLVDLLRHDRYHLLSVEVAETDNQGLIYYGPAT